MPNIKPLIPKFHVVFDEPVERIHSTNLGLFYYIDSLYRREDLATAVITDILDSFGPSAGFSASSNGNNRINLTNLGLRNSTIAVRERIASKGLNYVGKVNNAPVVWGNKCSDGVPLYVWVTIATCLKYAYTLSIENILTSKVSAAGWFMERFSSQWSYLYSHRYLPANSSYNTVATSRGMTLTLTIGDFRTEIGLVEIQDSCNLILSRDCLGMIDVLFDFRTLLYPSDGELI